MEIDKTTGETTNFDYHSVYYFIETESNNRNDDSLDLVTNYNINEVKTPVLKLKDDYIHLVDIYIGKRILERIDQTNIINNGGFDNIFERVES